ncbi:MAG TPA: carbamoyltransferase C-terminal domain-containing protein [bacterium]|jgi:carbamoyltransferase|nr:carbamoyltransferase C-terminal domain-containing protein [bacterium]
MPAIVGLNLFHLDSSACLVRDGRLTAAIAEERLGERIKHASCFPAHALRRVLDMEGLKLKDIDYIALGHDNSANGAAKLAYLLGHPAGALDYVRANLARRKNTLSLKSMVAEALGEPESSCRFKVVPVEHHLAHIASAFYCSPFEEAAGFSYDGSGDFVSAMYAHCHGTKIDVLKRVHLPHSLGIFYTAICQFIGFDQVGEEYKVMGLSAYGQDVYAPFMRKVLDAGKNGDFKLDQSYISALGTDGRMPTTVAGANPVLSRLYTDRLVAELGAPRRRGDPITQREMDLARSCQTRFEEVVLQSLGWLAGRVPVDALVTAGGCALNGVCNARILRDTPFRRTYIQCAASDDGTAVGAAYHVWHQVLGNPRVPAQMQAYLGPEYPENEIEAALREGGLAYKRLDDDALFDSVAGLLNQGKIVGWYQGRSEWGPRALGNRSILAHPGWPGMKDTINRRIKRREGFRPFAPSILAESVHEYFEQDVSSPFMMHVVRIREAKRGALAAVTHEDSTGRLQTVTSELNPRYYALIERFGRLSGTPVVLNTSFNENEPVVDTPRQAVACYLRNDIDALCLGNFLSVKGS